MEREYIERNAVLEEALNNGAVRLGIADKTGIKEIINDVPSADVVSVREYQELADENRELKRLLKLAIEDIDNCSFCSMCVNRNDYDKCKKCKAITLDMFKWEHGDEAEKLLKDDTVKAIADVQTVKHGKWRFSGNYSPTKNWICSECNGMVIMPVYCWKSYYNYCPNCGAKMDGEKNNGD